MKKVKPVLDKVKDSMEPLKKVSQAAGRMPVSDLTIGQQMMRNMTISGAQFDDSGEDLGTMNTDASTRVA